jgi:hypothetical protein
MYVLYVCIWMYFTICFDVLFVGTYYVQYYVITFLCSVIMFLINLVLNQVLYIISTYKQYIETYSKVHPYTYVQYIHAYVQ